MPVTQCRLATNHTSAKLDWILQIGSAVSAKVKKRNSASVDEIGDRNGEIPISAAPHGCETLPALFYA